MPLFNVVAEGLNPSETPKTDSIHKRESSESRTPLSLSRCTSGKSLLTSMRAACPAFIARESPLFTGPFYCSVYGAVSSRRIWRLFQYSTNAELVYLASLSVRNARRTPMSATKRYTTPRMPVALLFRVPYGRYKREALSANTTTYRKPPNYSWNGLAMSMWTMSSGGAARNVVRCGVGRGCPMSLNTLGMGQALPEVECRAFGRWLSVHSNGRGRGKRGSSYHLIRFFLLFVYE